jgi:ABC-2 type transport system permease protein
VENGDFAYDMTKPFNFMLRTIAEGVAELPLTVILIIAGGILGIITSGVLTTNILHIALSLVIMLLATVILILLNIIVALLSMWLGRDVSSIWLLCHKAMLIFAFTPVELFPKVAQRILLALPTTHVIYTPASLFVHFSTNKFVVSMLYVITSIALLSIILYVIYRKGVKKQNVNGI